MALRVIGAGFGRTGTFSLKIALEQLGFGPCCHGSEERHFRQGTNFWQRVFDRQTIDWDVFFEGYQSTVDSPSCKFYLDLAKTYPEAKIILTLREPNAWYESYQETVLPIIMASEGGKLFSFIFGNRRDRQSIIAAYERHNTEVQRLIPRERLLVYDVKGGWERLCEFLNVPIPATPFPYVNLRDDFPALLEGKLARLKDAG